MVQQALSCSSLLDIPVNIALDGENWWAHSNLMNWWDSSADGYNPANKQNVEWTGFPSNSSAEPLRISWRNWGRQIRVSPMMNLHSPALLNLTKNRLRIVGQMINDWAEKLTPKKKHLFGGIKVGWESGIGMNAFYYPNGNKIATKWPHDSSHDPTYGLHCSTSIICDNITQIGFAAASSAGWVPTGGAHSSVLSRFDIGNLTRLYVSNLTSVIHSIGIAPDKVFTHIGPQKPYNVTMPLTAASVPFSNPGFSFYDTIPQKLDALKNALAQTERDVWAASEFGIHASSKDGWIELFNSTLSFRDCRFLDFYNWNSFKESVEGIEAVRELVETSLTSFPKHIRG
eukprot:g4282.t1